MGSTNSHDSAPMIARQAAAKNAMCHPKRAARNGVSDVVTAPPTCAPMFMMPEASPAYSPAKSAVMAQKQLWAT